MQLQALLYVCSCSERPIQFQYRYQQIYRFGRYGKVISIGYWSISVRLRIQIGNSKLWLPGKNTILDAWFITTKYLKLWLLPYYFLLGVWSCTIKWLCLLQLSSHFFLLTRSPDLVLSQKKAVADLVVLRIGSHHETFWHR